MAQCNICKDPITDLDKPRKSHLVLHQALDGHVHVHGDLKNKENVREMLEVACEEVGVSLVAQKKELPKEIVFHNRQRIGDMLVFTCAIRDFKAAFPNVRVNVISTAGHIFDHNPNIDRTLVPTEQNTVMIGPKKLTNSSNRIDWHFTNAFRVSIEDALGIVIPQGESRPDIYLTEEEYNAPRIMKEPYWVICITGEKGWGCKMYPFANWQEFVNMNPNIKFVQIGAAGDNPPRLQGKNVVDMVGKTENRETGVRDLFKLFLNAEGSIGLVSFHMHLSGGLSKPAVIVAGAREPVHFTRYPGHAYLATDGMLPCATKACWHCDINACTNPVLYPDRLETKVPKCVDMITPQDLTNALNNYYIGGRLSYDKPSEKPKLKNVVKTPPKLIKETFNTYDMEFGGGSLTENDWVFIKKTIKDKNVKTVLEFGAGLSTLLLNDLGIKVKTYETNQGWINKIKQIKPECDIEIWDGKNLSFTERYELAFVDGPAGDIGREQSTRIASEAAENIIVHDAGREWARKYQDKYIKDKFSGPGKGGHRCHFWTKSSTVIPNPTITKPLNQAQKTIKIVSTARGWGGCARSVTTIMKLLLKQGHNIEFIPFRNSVSSSEWKAMLSGDLSKVKVTTDYSTIKDKCDVLLMYADDYIWEFKKPEIVEAFSNIGATKKIMMLNYRRGPVGQVEWTRNWDKYMFLNSTQETELLNVHAGVETKVLAPCTDLDPFFKVKLNYNHNLRIVRHSSQGDTKFDKSFFSEQVDQVLNSRSDVELNFLPGPSFINNGLRIAKFPRTDKPEVIADFLSKGNLFWYSLPEGYMDMGPRVILEGMASGLPVLADRWGGAVDRVTDETGWLCDNKEEHIEIIKGLTAKELERKGKSARERAYQEFRTEKWIEEIVG